MAKESSRAWSPGDEYAGRHKEGGTHPPFPHKSAKAKQVAVGTTQNHGFVKKTCQFTTLEAECEHDERKAVKKEGQWVLNVVPHDGGLRQAGNTKTSGGIGGKPFQTKAEEDKEDKRREATHHRLEAEGDGLKKRSAELAARRNQNTRNYRQSVLRLNRDRGSHTARLNEFIKDNRGKKHLGAELYLDQGNPVVSDKMTFHVKMARKCSEHPAWALWDCSENKWVETYRGDEWKTEELLPPVIDYSSMPSVLPKIPGVSNAYWLKSVRPRLYKAHLYTCDAHEVIHINVYPLVESGIDITIEREGSKNEPAKGSWASRIETCRDRFEDLVGLLSHIAPTGGTVEVEIFPEGKISLLNKWVEEEKTNEVVWEADVTVDVTIAEIKVVRPIIAGLPEFVMKEIRKVAEAGIDITLTLDASVGATVKWKQAPEEKMTRTPSGEIKGKGSLSLSAHATAHVHVPFFHRSTVHLDIGASTEMELTAEIEPETEGGEEKVYVDTKGHWTHPLMVSGSVIYGKRKPRRFSKDLCGPLPEHRFGKVALW